MGLVVTRAEPTVGPPRYVCSTCRDKPRQTENCRGQLRCVSNRCLETQLKLLQQEGPGIGGRGKRKKSKHNNTTEVSLLLLIRRIIKIFHEGFLIGS